MHRQDRGRGGGEGLRCGIWSLSLQVYIMYGLGADGRMPLPSGCISSTYKASLDGVHGQEREAGMEQ